MNLDVNVSQHVLPHRQRQHGEADHLMIQTAAIRLTQMYNSLDLQHLCVWKYINKRVYFNVHTLILICYPSKSPLTLHTPSLCFL